MAEEQTTSAESKMSPEELQEQAIKGLAVAWQKMRKEIGQVIVGQDQVIDELLIAMFCRGHVLLVGVPGLAKTLLCSTVASILKLSFRRIQFTPDLMPCDITGTETLQDDPETGRQSFQFMQGPLFTNVLLADDINRTPPKTQAALLEAMQDQHVTVGGESRPLPKPFFTLATQSPIEQEGTCPLPEAQLDRFMFNVVVDYPTADEELQVLKQTTGTDQPEVTPILSPRQIHALQDVVRTVPCAEHCFEYARDLVRATRPEDDSAPEFVRESISWGAGPRAGQFLILGARARALLEGRFHVSTDDIRSVAPSVLRHRLMMTCKTQSQGQSRDDVIQQLLDHVPVKPHERVKERTS